jgi:hypothetical protein
MVLEIYNILENPEANITAKEKKALQRNMYFVDGTEEAAGSLIVATKCLLIPPKQAEANQKTFPLWRNDDDESSESMEPIIGDASNKDIVLSTTKTEEVPESSDSPDEEKNKVECSKSIEQTQPAHCSSETSAGEAIGLKPEDYSWLTNTPSQPEANAAVIENSTQPELTTEGEGEEQEEEENKIVKQAPQYFHNQKKGEVRVVWDRRRRLADKVRLLRLENTFSA